MALDRLSQVTSSGISTTISFRAAGINVSGIVTASSFVGDGSGLTGVVGSGSGVIIKDDNATVGTASTINFGSNLSVSAISSGIVTVTGTDTNTTYSQAAVASGSNVNIRLSDSNSTTDDILLTAGSNVTFSSVTAAGFTINSSGSGGGSSSQFGETAAGIHTLSNVGIGTTNPTSKLTVTGDANITGVVTATSFSGDGSALTGITASQTPSFTTLNVVGVSTFAGITTVTGTTLFAKQLNVSGVVTATTFVGALTGTASNVTTNANLTGDVTSSGNATSIAAGVIVDADISASAAIALSKLATTGVVTATTFVGALTGTASNVTTNANLTGDVTSSGNATSIAAGVIVDADVNASAAIALSKLATTGILTATTFVGALTGNASSATIATYTSEWILGANGSSDYTFTGPGFTGAENDPTLYLIRGQQYKFTNTMGAHPFRIQSTVNGSTGTQYNDGITNNDVSNGTLTWNVQFDAPNILYYQCTAHSGMGGKIYILNSEDNVSAGTTSAPSISPSGDSNTGIFFPAPDTVAIAEGGVEILRVNSSGNIGIGTTDSLNKFEVGNVSGGVTAPDFTVSTVSLGSSVTIGRLSSVGSDNTLFRVRDRVNRTLISATVGGVDIGSTDVTTPLTIRNGNLVFSTAGTGIDFSATANSSGTMSSELLSDYEEGTWTPTFNGYGGAYTNQTGHYTKIGNVVSVWCFLQTSTTGSGGAQVNGLPFPTNISTYGSTSQMWGDSWTTGRNNVAMLALNNSSSILIRYNSGGGGGMPDVTLADIGVGNLLFQLTYRT
jgi:hypothetical protein